MTDTATWSIHLPDWTFHCQLTDPTSDGEFDQNASNNCLMSCLQMCIQFCTGVNMLSDNIKDMIYTESYTGFTYITDAQSFLKNYTDTSSYILNPTQMQNDTHTGLADLYWNYLVQGKPLISRYNMNNIPHYKCVIGLDASNVYMANPWNGLYEIESYANNWTNYRGYTLAVDRIRQV